MEKTLTLAPGQVLPKPLLGGELTPGFCPQRQKGEQHRNPKRQYE
jgi:hypothetical protein